MKTLPAIARRQRGVVLIMYAMLLTLILGFTGLVVDLGIVYLRRAQLQAAADNMALGAAHRLNGANTGVTLAVTEALARAAAPGLGAVGESDVRAALRFGATPHGTEASWLAADAAAAAPADIRYVRVDLGALPDALRKVEPILTGVLGRRDAFDIRPVAVAGRPSLNVMPLAICARDINAETLRRNGPASSPLWEKVAYGFRQGITYNLLMLNPHATTPVYYHVDPLRLAPESGSGANITNAVLAPFICSGTVAYPRIAGRQLNVREQPPVNGAAPVPFALWRQVNSRFNQYQSSAAAPACTRFGAPPDLNIKIFKNVSWQPATLQASAMPAETGGGLATVADRPWDDYTGANSPAPGEYGTRWAFRSPRNGSNQRYEGSWNVLYPTRPATNGPTASAWLSYGPYFHPNASASSAYYVKPVSPEQPAQKGRRLMHIPLLRCPVSNNRATVLAYGRFFLSAPASDSEIPGEFAGVVSLAEEGTLAGPVELVR